jgi:hypothetical protein
MRRLLLAGLCLLLGFDTAHAADQTVRGTAFIVRNPGPEAKRKITVKARESESDDTLVGDPVASGATVTISANGEAGTSETYAMPAGTSATTAKPFWSGSAAKGFDYRDGKGENGPVKRAQLKLKNGVFQLKVTVDGKLGPIGVVPPNPGSDGCVLLTITGGDSYSVRFASGRVTNKEDALFKVVKPVDEGSCLPPTTTSTTTTSSTTTSTIGLPSITPPGAAPLRYRDAVFETVATTSDVTYGSAVNGSGETVSLELDVYQPSGDAVTARPAIVWVHGGSFAFGSKTSPELVDEATVFATKGYVNVSIEYRLEPGGCSAGAPTGTSNLAIQEALADAQSAVRFLRTNAAT